MRLAEKSSIVAFAALESYSMVGGLQQFNRRVVSALGHLANVYERLPPAVVLKGDRPEHVSNRPEFVIFKACGSSRMKFLIKTLRASASVKILLLGHVNLLPLALLARIVNPWLSVVLFVHGEDVWNASTARRVKPWEPFLLRFVTRIASVSQFTADKMSYEFGVKPEKFSIFPNAVDPLEVGFEREEFGPVLLTVARLARHDSGKHHDSVLQALPRILMSFPEVRYRIIGDGELRPQLEAMANKLGVEKFVEFSGKVSDSELASAYAQASIFVMPSEKEGFGIVFLEAWLRGIPVICGTEDASHEIVSDGIDGYAVNHKDIEKLAERVIYLLQNPVSAAAMGNAGREKVLQMYVMERFTKNLDLLMSEALL